MRISNERRPAAIGARLVLRRNRRTNDELVRDLNVVERDAGERRWIRRGRRWTAAPARRCRQRENNDEYESRAPYRSTMTVKPPYDIRFTSIASLFHHALHPRIIHPFLTLSRWDRDLYAIHENTTVSPAICVFGFSPTRRAPLLCFQIRRAPPSCNAGRCSSARPENTST